MLEEMVENGDVSFSESGLLWIELANAYTECDRVGEAIKLLEHAVEVTRSKYAENDSTLLSLLQELAGSYFHQGETEKAFKIWEHVVAVLETGDGNATYLFESRNQLLAAYLRDNQLEKAAKHVELLTSTEEWESLISLGKVYFQAGQHGKAMEPLEHAVKSQDEELGEFNIDSPQYSQHCLALVCEATGRTEDATQLLNSIVAVRKRALP
ncbi:uncharacterized protein GLRG_04726 [Colletotrichum graminicola M1.001]|uniref:Tetratricopeptide repeat protein n=1 Tax=Colletotrichum graminicola (strain M1.001 / M2 / FGSC 10212) TaxID=645133 RepID=E3QFE4_COLGM|nr:uncharacterized protein GLRG_04726 [Colletotrichum graminicola M1.001]EFQ29582.1 hypothetical protein GLRG_04726 [Colletotrichum graminicola M1.001]